MLKAKTIILSLEEKIEFNLNVWLLKFREKKIRFFQQTYIPPVIVPIDREDPDIDEDGMEKISFNESREKFLYTILFED